VARFVPPRTSGPGTCTLPYPNHSKMKIKMFAQPRVKQTRTLIIDGIASANQWRYPIFDFVATDRLIKERFYYVCVDGVWAPPISPIDEDVFDRECGGFAYEIRCRVLINEPQIASRPFTYEEFLNQVPSELIDVYTQAVESLTLDPINANDFAASKAFGKSDPRLLSKNKCDRGICAVSPRANVEMGCYSRRIEDAVYHAIDQNFGRRTVMKGMTQTEVASAIRSAWDACPDPVAVKMDAVRCDQHFGLTAQKYFWRFFKLIWGEFDRHLNAMINWSMSGKIRMVCEECIFAFVAYILFSGVIVTSMMAIVVFCAIADSFAYEYSLHFHLINLGDDNLFIMDRSELSCFLDAMPSYYARFGFRVEIEKVANSFYEIVFCQSQPICLSPGVYTMVRVPSKAMARSCMTTRVSNTTELNNWLYTVGMGGIALNTGVPIMQEYYTLFRDLGKGGRMDKSRIDRHSGMARNLLCNGMPVDITADARESFYLAFDILPDDQYIREQFIRDVPRTIDLSVFKSDCRTDRTMLSDYLVGSLYDLVDYPISPSITDHDPLSDDQPNDDLLSDEDPPPSYTETDADYIARPSPIELQVNGDSIHVRGLHIPPNEVGDDFDRDYNIFYDRFERDLERRRVMRRKYKYGIMLIQASLLNGEVVEARSYCI
jgi:hypothetical protein